jgi:hypothetical protein
MPSVLAFRMSIQDMGAYYLDDAPTSTFCSECGSVVDKSFIPKALKIRGRREFALGCTYDNRYVCSMAMKELMQREGLAIDFWKVNQSPELYYFMPREQLAFDVQKRKTRFINQCKQCGQFAEVIGVDPVFLRNVNSPILEGIFRTDIEFGSGRSKSPIFIVGLRTKEVLERAKFKGCTYLPVVN